MQTAATLTIATINGISEKNAEITVSWSTLLDHARQDRLTCDMIKKIQDSEQLVAELVILDEAFTEVDREEDRLRFSNNFLSALDQPPMAAEATQEPSITLQIHTETLRIIKGQLLAAVLLYNTELFNIVVTEQSFPAILTQDNKAYICDALIKEINKCADLSSLEKLYDKLINSTLLTHKRHAIWDSALVFFHIKGDYSATKKKIIGAFQEKATLLLTPHQKPNNGSNNHSAFCDKIFSNKQHIANGLASRLPSLQV